MVSSGPPLEGAEIVPMFPFSLDSALSCALSALSVGPESVECLGLC